MNIPDEGSKQPDCWLFVLPLGKTTIVEKLETMAPCLGNHQSNDQYYDCIWLFVMPGELARPKKRRPRGQRRRDRQAYPGRASGTSSGDS